MSKIVEQRAANDVQVVGGKAAALARLAELGFNPPAFFVIPAETLEMNTPYAELSAAVEALGTGPYAVRSSARQEDGAEQPCALTLVLGATVA